MDGLKIFTGRSNKVFAERICDYLGLAIGRAHVENFPDTELIVKLVDDVRGRDAFVVQSTCAPVNDNLMELLTFMDCLRRASARRITAVMPYFGYARQDRKDEGRVPITAKLVSNLIATAGADRVLAIDLHAAQIQGFFDIPVDHLLAEPVFLEYFKTMDVKDPVFLSPDVGNVKRSRSYAEKFHADLAIIDKRRISGSEARVQTIIGSVKGRDVIMVDDMIATAGTITQAAAAVQKEGARSIRVAATHAVLCGPAVERLCAAPIDEIVVTDTIDICEQTRRSLPGLKVLSVAPLFGEAIRRIHRNESVSILFVK
jgi:ribose-phosphate pyrophosphokinase